MVAPNLALTARHCVSNADDSLGCDLRGTPITGGRIHEDYNAPELRFYVGAGTPDIRSAPAAVGARIIHDGASNLCAHDLAFVLLDRSLATPIMPMRLDADPARGEAVRVVGWGLIGLSPDTTPDVRQQRDVSVINVGPKQTDQFLTLTPADFSLGESICSGDSGGPVIARETGAVIGVISHGDSCFGPGEYNVMTKIAPFRTLIDASFGLAGTLPKKETLVVHVGGGGEGICRVAGDPTEGVMLFSAFFLWAMRRRRFAR